MWRRHLPIVVFLVAGCTANGPLVSAPSSPTVAAVTSASPSSALPCSRVELSAAQGAEVEAGTAITFTAVAYGCVPADYRFIWFQVDTGDWQVAREWGPSPQWTWDTRPFSPAGYSVVADARARYELGNVPDASISVPVTLDAPAEASVPASLARPNACTAVTVSVRPASTVAAGTIVFFKAAARGCDQPDYRFRLIDLSTGLSRLNRDWGPSPDGEWTTTAGRFAIVADARESTPGRAGYELDTTSQAQISVT